MSNIYDTFRSIQTKRNTCYNKRSANFIEEGQMSQIITNKRTETDIKAGVVFSHKEGPDEVYVYTYIKDDLLKSDYFVYDNTNFLVYEDVRLTDKTINYKKQNAIECNAVFTFENETFIGYYKSALRGSENPDFIGSQLITPNESPILILPTNSIITVGSEFIIEEKPFKVSEYDNITNKGITYYYLERSYTKKEIAPTVNTEEVIMNQDSDNLRSMTEYVFDTVDGYFAASPKVEIIKRLKSKITFRIPFGTNEVNIEVKSNEGVISKLYEVVL